MGLLAVEPQPEQAEPRFFVQSLSHDSETVGIIKCPANLVSLKHLKLKPLHRKPLRLAQPEIAWRHMKQGHAT